LQQGVGGSWPVILASQETERSGGLQLEASPGKYFERLYLKKTHHKKGMVEWLKV
jgi:hypothetical protein